MAEITTNSNSRGSEKRRRSLNRSTRIDMTPLVDLAFLLLTFFILTRTFYKPHALEVTMPDHTGVSAPVSASNVLNLVLSDGNRIHWSMGQEPPTDVTDYSSRGVRKLLSEKASDNPLLMVLIKPADNSRFQNIVDILDEMEITGVRRFAIVDLTDVDKEVIALK